MTSFRSRSGPAAPGDGLVPLVGCPVKVRSGIHEGESGTVVSVVGFNERIRQQTDGLPELAKASAARLGGDWTKKWYTAEVSLPGNVLVVGDDTLFEILDPAQTRGPGYRKL